MFDELRGKSVLISGASTGIGAAVTRGFGRYGASVGVHCHRSVDAAEDVARAVQDAGGAAAVLQGDVTDKAEVGRIIDAHVQEFGRLDVLINNAGDVVRRSAFEQLDDDLIDYLVALNARAVVTACRLALPHFLRQGRGNIINTTSLAARQAGGPGSSVYTACKGFAQSLTRFLAREYAPRNIRVNAVAPGLIMTPLQDRSTTPAQLEVMETWVRRRPSRRWRARRVAADALAFCLRRAVPAGDAVARAARSACRLRRKRAKWPARAGRLSERRSVTWMAQTEATGVAPVAKRPK